MSVNSLRWGLIGYGSNEVCDMGTHHATQIEDTKRLELVAICDINPSRLNAARKIYANRIRYFDSYLDLIESKCCDGVTVALPHHLHTKVCLDLLNAGLHIIKEKPFALNPEDCTKMIKAAKRNGVMLTVYHNRHWDPDIMTMRRIVESGKIGKIVSIEHYDVVFGRPRPREDWWRSDKVLAGSTMFNRASHTLEKVFQLTPKHDDNNHSINNEVTILGNFRKIRWKESTNEDYGRMYMIFDSGIETTVTVSNVTIASQPGWIVSGSKGSCISVRSGCDWVLKEPKEIEIRRFVNGQIVHERVPFIDDPLWHNFYDNVVNHLFNDVPLDISLGTAKAVAQCIYAAEQSSIEGKAIQVKLTF